MKFFLLKNRIFLFGIFFYSMYSIKEKKQEKDKLNIRLFLFFYWKIYIKNRKTLNLKIFNQFVYSEDFISESKNRLSVFKKAELQMDKKERLKA